MKPSASIRAIYRYPVKGLSAQALASVMVAPGSVLPADRLYAIENGPLGFDPSAPAYYPKTRFLMLMRDERLAALRTSFDDTNHRLTIRLDNRTVAEGDLDTPPGRATIEAFFAAYCANELHGPPRIVTAPGHSFSDVARKVVSLINLESVRAIEETIGKPVDPLRFRGNLYIAGWSPWSELDLVGQTLAIGDVRLNAVKRIVRCAATNVDPATGARGLNIPKTLMQTYGHADCGIYAEVIAGGEIATGDAIVSA